METVSFRLVYNRRNKLNNQGKAPVEIYVYAEGRVKYLKTGMMLEPHEWDKRYGKVSDMHLNHHRVNYQLKVMLSELEEHAMNCIAKTGVITMNDIDNYASQGDHGSFIDFLNTEIRADRNVTPGTMRYRLLMAKKLKDAVGNVTFKGVNYSMLTKFEQSMDVSVRTREKHHIQLRKYINVAVRKNLVKENPYKHFKIKKAPKKLRRILWWDDLQRIWETPSRFEATKRRFLFSCFTGLRISDSLALKWADIQRGRIVLKMQKTQAPVIVPLDLLSDIPGKILEDLGEGEVVFQHISEQKINAQLKYIAVEMGVPFSLHFHISRHTFCTLVADKTGSMFSVMRYAGITQVSTANVYVNLAKMFA